MTTKSASGNRESDDLLKQLLEQFDGELVTADQIANEPRRVLHPIGECEVDPDQLAEALDAVAAMPASQRVAAYPIICPIAVEDSVAIREIAAGKYKASAAYLGHFTERYALANHAMPVFILNRNTRGQWLGVYINTEGEQRQCSTPAGAAAGDGSFARMMKVGKFGLCIVVVSEKNWAKLKSTVGDEGMAMVLSSSGQPESIGCSLKREPKRKNVGGTSSQTDMHIP